MPEVPIILSKHAIERAKQRLGLAEPQLARTMAKIHRRGATREHMGKELRQYFDRRLTEPDSRRESVIHDGHLFIVDRGVLVTVVEIPAGLKRFAVAAAKANRAAQNV